MKRIAFYTQGCRANKADAGWLSVLATRKNFKVVDEVTEADAVVINTCTVTHGADRDCRQMVRKLHRLNPQARFCLVGCFSQLQPEAAAKLPGVDYIGGTAGKDRVLDFIEKSPERQPTAFFDETTFETKGFLNPNEIPKSDATTRLFLKIQDGCDHRCTYCIIHRARGASRSMDIDEVVGLINRAVTQGIQEVVLTGIDLGSFRQGLLPLLEAIEVRTRLPRLRLSSLSPRELPSDLLSFVAQSQRVCPSFHISLQHGDRQILKRMARPYSPQLFRDKTEEIRRLMPEAYISLDVIVGFPGETDEAFENLFQLLEETAWTRGHFFPFSPRSGTPSEMMDGQVPASLKTERMNRLLELDRSRFVSSLQPWVSRQVEVLVEKQSSGFFTGHTREFFPVAVEGDDLASNQVIQAHVCGLSLEGSPRLEAQVVS